VTDELDAVARTARWTAASRARESARVDRLFDDPLAHGLAGDEGYALLDAEPAQTAGNPLLPIRTRFFDDWLERVAAHGVRQLVIVAGGMDVRAFRLDWPPVTSLWELDRPALLALKNRILDGQKAVPRCQRHCLGIDLRDEAWPAALRETGFAPDEPAAWLVEGLVQYLEEGAVRRLLTALAALSAPGSQLGIDMLSRDFLTHEWMAPHVERMARAGTPWQFGTNEPEALLAELGWEAAVTQPGEDGASFGRWPWPVAPREVPGWPRNFLITANRAAH
jgi:methyltransferase (TIGR00027 family)